MVKNVGRQKLYRGADKYSNKLLYDCSIDISQKQVLLISRYGYLNVINRNIKVSVVNKSTLSELGEQNIEYCKNLASIWQLFVILLTGFKYCTSACLLSQQNTDILENKGKMLTQRVVAQAGSCPYVLI